MPPVPAPAMLIETTLDDGNFCLGWYDDFMSAYRAALQIHARDVGPFEWKTETIDQQRDTIEKWKPTLEAALEKTFVDVREANDFLMDRGNWMCPGQENRSLVILAPDCHEVRSVSVDDVRAGLWSDGDRAKRPKVCWCMDPSYFAAKQAQDDAMEAAIQKVRDDLKWDGPFWRQTTTKLEGQLRAQIEERERTKMWGEIYAGWAEEDAGGG